MKSKDVISGFILFFLTILSYILTVLPLTQPYILYLLAFCFLTFTIFFVLKKRDNLVFVYSAIVSILLIVGITGWFHSPLFSWLYVLAIALSFIFNPFVSNTFILILTFIFMFYLDFSNVNYEAVLTLASLILIIPLSAYLRKKYLRLKEDEKKILVLREEVENEENKLKEILGNKISKESVDLEEPLNDINQISLYFQKGTKKSTKKDWEKISTLSQKALSIIKQFERDNLL